MHVYVFLPILFFPLFYKAIDTHTTVFIHLADYHADSTRLCKHPLPILYTSILIPTLRNTISIVSFSLYESLPQHQFIPSSSWPFPALLPSSFFQTIYKTSHQHHLSFPFTRHFYIPNSRRQSAEQTLESTVYQLHLGSNTLKKVYQFGFNLLGVFVKVEANQKEGWWVEATITARIQSWIV